MSSSSLTQHRRLLIGSLALLASGLLASPASAVDVAYWRHEEGPAGQIVPGGPDTVLDSSGNGNHMQTFASGVDPFTAATYTPNVSPLPLRSGLPNTLSLDFGPNPTGFTDDGGGQNDDNYTAGEPIQTYLFNSITIELAFNMNSVGGWQAIFGKDGKPIGDSPVPPLKFLIRDDAFPDDVPNQLFIEWIDGNSVIRSLATRETVVAGEWNHVALTLSATEAQLWVAGETGGYVLKDSLTGTFDGPGGDVLFPDPTSFTVGRGMFNNGVTDWANAVIDEVRISDAILTPEQFLFDASAVAEDGDFNGDNVVDGADFLIWQRGFGPTGTNLTGDANGNGVVDGADLAIWKSQFGGAPAAVAAAAVPEPATLALGGLAIVCMGMVSRRR
ncbi:MAG: hypothetical protein C0485_06200 [Pirellula sp.]|nr:hypothetical protein [Pirellula sp.]